MWNTVKTMINEVQDSVETVTTNNWDTVRKDIFDMSFFTRMTVIGLLDKCPINKRFEAKQRLAKIFKDLWISLK